jgi:hypothetical protein
MNVPTSRIALVALALATLAAPANADFLTTSMDTSTPVMTFSIPSAGINGESGYVGPNTVSFDGSAPFQAYCTDLYRSIGVNDQYAAQAAPLSDLSNGGLVSKLFTVDAAMGDGGALEKAALQLAIWNVVETGRAGGSGYTDPFAYSPLRVDRGSDHIYVYGDDARTQLLFGLSSGSLVVDGSGGSGVLNRMDDLLFQASNLAGPGADLLYIAPSTSYGQGFVGLRTVPEPSSLILSSLGLSVIVGVQLRWRCRTRLA